MLKRFLIFAALLACAFATSVDSTNGRKVASADGQKFKTSVQTYDGTQQPNARCMEADFSESSIRYILHTREKPDGEVIISNPAILSKSSINVKKSLKVLIHGWSQNITWAKPMIREYLYTRNTNVLVVDWSAYSEYCDIKSTSLVITSLLGKSLSLMLKLILAIGHSNDNMHLIGFGNGAHVAGVAARDMAPHLPARITGLDPLFLKELDKPGAHKLNAGDAQFIDIIVSALFEFSFEEEIGHVSFYPNGGLYTEHPDCQNMDPERQVICGHSLSYKLFFRSLSSPKKFLATLCKDWEKYKSGKCNGEPVAHMGEFVEKNARGKYFLRASLDSA